MLEVVLVLVAVIVGAILVVALAFALGARQLRRHEAREAVRRRLSRLTGVQL